MLRVTKINGIISISKDGNKLGNRKKDFILKDLKILEELDYFNLFILEHNYKNVEKITWRMSTLRTYDLQENEYGFSGKFRNAIKDVCFFTRSNCSEDYKFVLHFKNIDYKKIWQGIIDA